MLSLPMKEVQPFCSVAAGFQSSFNARGIKVEHAFGTFKHSDHDKPVR